MCTSVKVAMNTSRRAYRQSRRAYQRLFAVIRTRGINDRYTAMRLSNLMRSTKVSREEYLSYRRVVDSLA